ncbi:MAG TPA: sulfatase [Methylomirabilota bacterium]|nr:sulfatase [Methylomirabilota bacterium]
MAGRTTLLFGFLAIALTTGIAAAADPPRAVVVVTIDTLRPDRLGCYGYQRPTSPAVDALLARGARFERARTDEPLTTPAMCTMVTGLEPHVHGASRNGLGLEPGVDSLPKRLASHGWHTAAFVSNWTLKDKLSNLGEHFDHYAEVFTRRRWFGLLNAEATGEDVTDEALDWAGEYFEGDRPAPLFLWVHYVEPHAPYRFHTQYADRLGITDRDPVRSDRYDTEVAAVDAAVGRLLDGLAEHLEADRTITVFTADHGESLGEHDYWGHGRNLYDPSLRIPLGIVWPGTVEQGTIREQATLLDLAPTILELLGYPVPEAFPGQSWAAALRGGPSPPERAICYQAHKGAVLGESDHDRKRSKGLLSVAVVEGDVKEILRVKDNSHHLFDLAADPLELDSLVTADLQPSEAVLTCLVTISEGLGALDRLTTKKLDDETVEQLRALGYVD